VEIFYDDYTGTDSDNDGIGEIDYNVSGVFDYLPLTNDQTIDDFKISNNQTINLGENAILELSIKNIVSTSDLNISWNDSTNTYNISAQSNGTIYTHNYTSFGNYTVNASLIGRKSGGLCIAANTYTATMWVNVIGYGDGIINGNESCDTDNFAGATCNNYDGNAGLLVCNAGVIDSTDCYTESSGGGGGSSSSNDDDEITEILNVTAIGNLSIDINKTDYNYTHSVVNMTLNINQTRFEKINLSSLNITLPSKKNQTEEYIEDLMNYSDMLKLNLTMFPQENETLPFEFKPYLNIIFDFFELNFDEGRYNFKPRASLIFTQLKNDIDWSEKEDEIYVSDFDFKLITSTIFDQFKNDIDWTEEEIVQINLIEYDFKNKIINNI